MKVLFCDNSLRSLINFRNDVICSYAKDGWEVVLVAPKDFEYHPDYGNIKYIEVKMHRSSKNIFKDTLYFHTLYSIYRKERPDYIFHYTIKPNIYGTVAARLCNIPSTAMLPGLGYAFNKTGGSAIARSLYRMALRFSDYVMVLNRYNRDVVLREKIAVPRQLILLKSGEGINLEYFDRQPLETLHKSDKTVFLMISRLLYDKGYSEYVNAAKEIKAAYPQTEFRLLGNVDESYPNFVPASVVRNDDEVGYINYLGFKSDVRTSLYEADCIVHPSFYNEGLSRVLMEALAMQKPIITTDIPGCRETVDPGRNGYIVKAHSVESLADGIRKFLALSEDERKQMGIYGRRKAEKEFDVKNVIAVYKKITDRLQTNQDNHHE